MYTNIDPREGITVIEKFFNKFDPGDHNHLLNDLLSLVMRNNVFRFGQSYWKQHIGTAMRTPRACIYGTLFYACHEISTILPKYQKNLLLYKHFIDNIFGVWTVDPNQPSAWSEFKRDLDRVSKLTWETSDLQSSVNGLDLTVTIAKNGSILICTFQKDVNLFLYMLSHSAHPPGLLQSLVYGMMKTYREQNSNWHDFTETLSLFYSRLLARRYTQDKLKDVFLSAAAKLDTHPKTN